MGLETGFYRTLDLCSCDSLSCHPHITFTSGAASHQCNSQTETLLCLPMLFHLMRLL